MEFVLNGHKRTRDLQSQPSEFENKKLKGQKTLFDACLCPCSQYIGKEDHWKKKCFIS